MNFTEHISEDALEQYATRALPEPNLAALEEHLLIFADCRGRLESTEQYVDAMQAAAARIRKIETGE